MHFLTFIYHIVSLRRAIAGAGKEKYFEIVNKHLFK